MNQPTRLAHIEFELCQPIQKQGSPRLRSLINFCNLRVEQTGGLTTIVLSSASHIVNLKMLKALAEEVRSLGQHLGVDEYKLDWQDKVFIAVERGKEIAFVASLPVDEQGVGND